MPIRIERIEDRPGFFKKTWEQLVNADLGDKLMAAIVLCGSALMLLLMLIGAYFEFMELHREKQVHIDIQEHYRSIREEYEGLRDEYIRMGEIYDELRKNPMPFPEQKN